MLIETVNANFIESHLVEILLAAFGSTIIGLAIELRCKVGSTDKKIDNVDAKVQAVQLDLAKNYRLKIECRTIAECPQEQKVASSTAPPTSPAKDLTSGVRKINTDLAVLTSDIEDLKSITSGTTLNKAIA